MKEVPEPSPLKSGKFSPGRSADVPQVNCIPPFSPDVPILFSFSSGSPPQGMYWVWFSMDFF